MGWFKKQKSTSSAIIIKKIKNVFRVGGSNSEAWPDKQFQEWVKSGYEINPIVNQCIDMVANGVVKCPILIKDENKETLENTEIESLLIKPSRNTTRFMFMKQVIADLLICGECFIEGVYSQSEAPVTSKLPAQLKRMNPQYIKIHKGADYTPSKYVYDDTENQVRKVFNVDTMGRSNILHIKIHNPINPWRGLSPLKSISYAINQYNTAAKWNFSLIKRGGRKDLVVTVPKNTSSEQMQNIEDDLANNDLGVDNVGGALVLSEGTEVKEIGLSPKDMDFSNMMKMTANEIAFALGVPLDLINTEQSKYDNLNAANELFYDNTIIPIAKYLDDSFTMFLADRFTDNFFLYTDFSNVPALALRMAAKREKLSKIGFMTINEKRAEVGMPEIDGGNVLDTQSKKVDFSVLEDLDEEKKMYVNGLINDGYTIKEAQKMCKVVYGAA